jgi:exopolysaccharide biosynthesis polyprenyl glycosylphosphotransferase
MSLDARSTPLYPGNAAATSTDAAAHGEDAVLRSNGRARSAFLAAGKPRARRRGWLVRRMLLAADVIGLLVAFLATEALFSGTNPRVDTIGIPTETAIFVATLPVWLVAAQLYGLYDKDEEGATHSTADEFVNVFHLITVGVWVFFALSWLTGLTSPSQPKLATFWMTSITFVVFGRTAARALARRRPAYVQNTVIVGAGDVGQLVGRKLVQHPEYGINLVGFLDAEPKERRADLADAQLLGPPEELTRVVREERIDRVIVAFSKERHKELLELVWSLREDDVQIDLVPRLFEAVNPQVGIHSLEGFPLLGLGPTRVSRSSLFLKRSLDLVGASILVVAVAPLLALIAALVRRDSPGPIFFRQERLGRNMRPFTLLKFRTMRPGSPDEPDEARLTGLGALLRAWSIDELPQLWNVLRGDMSLVGPRPLLPVYLDRYTAAQARRHEVRPGITGLAQVSGRNALTWEEKFALDVWYVDHRSLRVDLWILWRTLVAVARREGVSASGHATMPEFLGS